MAQGSGEIGQAMDPAEGASNTSSTSTSDEIRSDIEQTRAEMSETIDAIQGRLSPSRLVADATETVKEATVVRVKRLTQRSTYEGGLSESGPSTIDDVLRAARQNPIPVAVAGVAAMATLLRALKRSRNGSYRAPMNSTTGVPVRSRVPSNDIARNKGWLFAGICAGLACWGVLRSAAIWRPAADTGAIADDSSGRTFPGTRRP